MDADRSTVPPASSRERLVQAASVLFKEEGYRHVSLGRVLRESGVCRSNFYYHFLSKEELALAVMDEWLAEFHRTAVEPVMARDDLGPFERVRLLVNSMIERLEADGCRGGCPFGTMANSEAEHNERFRAKLVEVFDAFSKALEGMYQAAIDAGELRVGLPGGARKLAAGTLAFIQGGYLLTKAYAGSAPLRVASEGWLDLLESSSTAAPPDA